MYILYSLLLALAVLISLPWWVLQMLRLGKYRAGLAERLGRVPDRLKQAARPGSIWIHAVSVGEVLAVSHLIGELRKAWPERPVFVSTTTSTGQRLARERFGEEHVFYMPLDFGFALRAYLRMLQPKLLILAETEFWPNLVHLAKKQGSAVATVNARISDRSFPRYRRFRWFFAPVLSQVNLFLPQTEEDARRLRVIGAADERVQVSGNLKFDIRPSSSTRLVEELRAAIRPGSPVIVCGSTAEGEEGLLLEALQSVLPEFPAVVMVLAPRHPERFDKVANLVASMGLTLARRSAWNDGSAIMSNVFLLDTVGELASVYALADISFVGGSLVPTGGHNILEPAQHGVAIMVGPHTFNFREIVRIFEEGNGISVVTADDVSRRWLELLKRPEERKRLGQRARELFTQHTGATQKTLQALAPLLGGKAGEVQ
jgi:3-deoxy-D-manno-octulosonic-acid transferase